VIESFRNIFAIPDLRKRVLSRSAARRLPDRLPHPEPGVDRTRARLMRRRPTASSGSQHLHRRVCRRSRVSRGTCPNITASIILQLLTVVWPYLEKLSKRGRWAGARSRSGRATAACDLLIQDGIAIWLGGVAPRAPWCPTPGGSAC